MGRSIILRKAKKNMEGDIQIKVIGETFNFMVYGGCGAMHIHKKIKKMTITDNLKIWFRLASESRGKL
jgi:acyl CoA:acetate/3-ketoacid CoA transferase beta subunit